MKRFIFSYLVKSMITFNRRMKPNTHIADILSYNCETVLRHSSNTLLRAGTWQTQVFSRKYKYKPNLMTFQNKEHYRKKDPL